MISSLLSIFIASTIQPQISSEELKTALTATSIETISLESNSKIPIKNAHYISPIIQAKSSISVDLKTGIVLYEKNAHERVAIASITKLMTVLIILEENELNETVTVSHNSAITEGSTMYLVAGEKIALENLVYGAMIQSANDAAVALAEHNAGSVDKFVEKMNAKAKKLGLVNTNFSNPIGLDSPNNYSSAYDVAKLGKEIYKKQFVQHAVSLKELEVKSVSGNYIHRLKSTNELLDSYLHVKGLKTGKTDAAGLCLTVIAENNSKDEILTVVLNSPDRFKETKILVDWIFRAYTW